MKSCILKKIIDSVVGFILGDGLRVLAWFSVALFAFWILGVKI